ncbi:unnamed protein product [Nezara viridula]|uniref:Uncharacterized protein n=1 Tax=Nezara viridula TaxID=85310 RepID=A0A9P0H1S1_NEZVI|nr:unnamed protein product [Nezara viridula]
MKKLPLRFRASPLVVSGVARVLPCISGILPSFSVSQEVRNEFASVELGDPQFHTPAKFDLLLGAEIPALPYRRNQSDFGRLRKSQFRFR